MMKRKLLCTLLCLLLIFCSFTADAFSAKIDSENVDWGLSFMIDELTPTGMAVIIEQSGGHYSGQLEYCECFRLQVREGKTWVDVPVKHPIPCLLDPDNIRPNARTRIIENWELRYGALPLGHYRYVKTFTEFDRDNPTSNIEVDFYAEFVIADLHTCHSNDGDQMCDVCLAIVPHRCNTGKGGARCEICEKNVDVYRVVGNADWMGRMDANSDAGLMTEEKSGIFVKTFYNVPPGNYELKVTKNGSFDESWGKDGENYCFELEKYADVTVTFYLKSDGFIRVSYAPVSGHEPEDVYRVVGSADWLGQWDPANGVGVMKKVVDGVYRKTFLDVPPGTYKLKITRNGSWDTSWGDGQDQNGEYVLKVLRKTDLTVEFTLNNDTGAIKVVGNTRGWDDPSLGHDYDEEQDENPKTADLEIGLSVALLLCSAAALPLLLCRKTEEML